MRAVENSSGLSGPIVVTNAAGNPWRLTARGCTGRDVAVATATRNVVSPVARVNRPTFWPDYREGAAVASVAQGSGGGLGRLGVISEMTCSEYYSMRDRLRETLNEARSAGIDSNSVTFRAANTFYERESSWWTTTDPWIPSTCARVTGEGESYIRALSAAISAKGGQVIPQPEVPPSPTDWTGTIKTVAIAVAVVAGAVTIAPIVFELVGVSKMLRKGR